MTRHVLKLIYIILIMTICFSCKTLTNLGPEEYSINQLTESDFRNLNGTFNNIQDTGFGVNIHNYSEKHYSNTCLLDRLFLLTPKYSYNDTITVNIEFKKPKKAHVTAYKSGQFFLKKTIRGKFKNGYFYVRPKGFIIPFFPIYYWHNFQKARISKNGNDLIIDYRLRSWGFALIAGGSDNELSTSVYKNIK